MNSNTECYGVFHSLVHGESSFIILIITNTLTFLAEGFRWNSYSKITTQRMHITLIHLINGCVMNIGTIPFLPSLPGFHRCIQSVVIGAWRHLTRPLSAFTSHHQRKTNIARCAITAPCIYSTSPLNNPLVQSLALVQQTVQSIHRCSFVLLAREANQMKSSNVSSSLEGGGSTNQSLITPKI